MHKNKVVVVILIIMICLIISLVTYKINVKETKENKEILEIKEIIRIMEENGEEIVNADTLNQYLREFGVMATAISEDTTKIVFDNGNKYKIEDNVTITKDESNLDANVLASDTYNIQVKFLMDNTNSQNDTPNKPELSEEMIPIKWNGENWIITNENDPDWYNYALQIENEDGTSQWANVMLSDGKYSTINQEGKVLVTDSLIGTKVTDEELGSMFVWIPRFAYKIEYFIDEEIIAYSDARGFVDANGKIIREANDQGIRVNSGDNYIVHPAFLGKGYENAGGGFGKDANGINGLWIAKFEASNKNEIDYIKDEEIINEDTVFRFIPSTMSFSIEYNLEKIRKEIINKIQEKSTDTMDMHVTKISEWGAMVYLAYSAYGRNGNSIDINSAYYSTEKNNAITGYGASGDGYYYIYNEKNYSYKTDKGVLASSTGNVYGIYDIAGGTAEMVMGFKDTNNIRTLIDGLDNKYYMLYKNNKSGENNVGDLIFETEYWNDDGSDYVNTYEPIFKMGGKYDLGCAGMFNYSAWSNKEEACSFRVTIVLK